jgi:hypothetical protein
MRKGKKDRSAQWQSMESLEPRLLLSGDLVVSIDPNLLPAGESIPTGYTFKVPVQVTNNTDEVVSGSAGLKIELLDGSQTWTLITTTVSGTISVGGSTSTSVAVTVPAGTKIGSDTFRVTFTPQDTAPTQATVAENIVWQFGNFNVLGSMKNAACVAVDPQTGHTATFSLSGPGSGALLLDGDTNLWGMLLVGTTGATKVKVVTPTNGGPVDLESVSAGTMVGSLDAANVDFSAGAGFEDESAMTFAGGLLSLKLHDVSPLDGLAHQITIDKGDSASDAVALTFNNANDLAINSQIPIASFAAASLTAHNSTDNDYEPEIYAPWVGPVAITGDFVGVNTGGGTCFPEIYADGSNPKTALGVASVKIGGDLDRSEVYADYGGIGNVTIGGDMDDGARVYAYYGSIGAVKVTGNVNGESYIETEYGNIGAVTIGGNLDNDSYVEVSDNGNIGQVTIGGNLDHSSEIYISDYGNIAGVTVKGNVDNEAEIYISEYGNIGPVSIGKNLDHNAEVYADYGNIASVKVAGNVDNGAEITNDDYGNVGAVTIGGNLDNGAEVYAYMGNIASVKVGGNVDHNARIETSDAGDLGAVTIGGNLDNNAQVRVGAGIMSSVKITGNLDHGAEAYADYGDIGTVTVGKNLDNGAEVYADEGNIASVTVGGNLDHNAQVRSVDGTTGIGALKVAKNVGSGVSVSAYMNIGTFSVGGDVLGTSGLGMSVTTYGLLKTFSVAGKALYTTVHSNGGIGSVSVGGVLQNSQIVANATCSIGSVTVGQLDSSVINAGQSGQVNGTRSDFYTHGYLGSLTIKGIKDINNVVQHMTGTSQVFAWILDKVSFTGTSSGAGLIEYHTGKVPYAPTGVTVTKVA